MERLPKVGEIYKRVQASVNAGAPATKVLVTQMSMMNDSGLWKDVVHFRHTTSDFINMLPVPAFLREFEKQKHYILREFVKDEADLVVGVSDTPEGCSKLIPELKSFSKYSIQEWEEGATQPTYKKFDCQTGKEIENKKNFEITVLLQKKFVVKETTKEKAVECAYYEMKGELKLLACGSEEVFYNSPLLTLGIKETGAK